MHFFGHLKTITHHRHVVFVHCVKAGIPLRGLLHDLSKYSPTEFLEGIRFYAAIRSPNVGAREKYGYSKAWMHHKGRNRHHFEYWTDYSPTAKKMMPVKMPPKFVAEMFCDRVAASKVYRGKEYDSTYPLSYYLRGKDTRVIHPETAAELERLLRILATDGEKEAFLAVRQMVKNGY